MSSDFVKRLRDYECSIDIDRGFRTGLTDTLCEAADRIESIEAEIVALKFSNDLFAGAQTKAAEHNTQLTVQLVAAEARAERLRAALLEI